MLNTQTEEKEVEVEHPNKFRSYGKIHRLGKEETDGILLGVCYIEEKIDGANTSIWRDLEGNIKCGSRTRMLGEEEFNGFVPYVRNDQRFKELHDRNNNPRFKELLDANPKYRLYGEWLVRHTIAYKETAYKKWYMFDIWDGEKYLPFEDVKKIADAYEITTVPFIEKIENPTVEYLQTLIGKTELGDRGEGVVIKNLDFKNKFEDTVFAKIVTESFKEDNAVTFGGNNKHSDTYYEVYVVNKYMTLPRVQKIMNKIQPEINERFDMKHIPRIMGTCFHDMIVEEMWEIVRDVPKLDFKILKRIADKKSKQIFVDIINESISVADRIN